MRVLVCSLQDPASCNIRDRLLERATWSEAAPFRGHASWQREGVVMVQVDGPSVTDEALDGDLTGHLDGIHAVWFLSKHVARSGEPSLTVHPNGNPTGEARVGGQPGRFSTAAPRDMGLLLRALRRHAEDAGLPHNVTYEATHHGPFMRTPALFVEIGSDESWYEDRQSAEVLADSVLEALQAPAGEAPVYVGVGGGHYVPRHNDKALAQEADFGHLIPAYAVAEDSEPDMLARAVEATPECDGVYMHKKGLKGWQRQLVKDWCAQDGLTLV